MNIKKIETTIWGMITCMLQIQKGKNSRKTVYEFDRKSASNMDFISIRQKDISDFLHSRLEVVFEYLLI